MLPQRPAASHRHARLVCSQPFRDNALPLPFMPTATPSHPMPRAAHLKWLGAALVAMIGYFCFMQHRGDPAQLFWDENYHVTSAQRYLEGYAQLTPHPPLGLLLIAAGERLSGANEGIDKHVLTLRKSITGEELPAQFDFSGMRLIPSLFAVLGALAFYGLMLEVTGTALPATLLSGLFLFENAFVTHFRAVHLEGIQMAFMVAAVWLFVRSWKRAPLAGPGRCAALTGLCTLAILVKANAVFLLLMPLLLALRDLQLRDEPITQRVRQLLVAATASLVTALATVFLVMLTHVLVSHRMPDLQTPSGTQDFGGMSLEYRQYAAGRRALSPALVWSVTLDELRALGNEHLGAPRRRLNDPTENGSPPWHWPFHDRNINYRWDSADGRTAYVELVGNQLAWYSGTIAVFASLLLTLRHRLLRRRPSGQPETWQLIECLTVLYAAFMLMSIVFESRRVMYLYHYFPGLMLSYVLLALWWQRGREISRKLAQHGTRLLAVVMAVFLTSYLFFLPLNNHVPLTKTECERRNIWISYLLDCR